MPNFDETIEHLALYVEMAEGALILIGNGVRKAVEPPALRGCDTSSHESLCILLQGI